jgi:RimJ/RimL family protein N-acetyltransferase
LRNEPEVAVVLATPLRGCRREGSAWQNPRVLDHDAALDTTLPAPVTLRRLTSADAVVFAEHIALDLERLGEYLPWPAHTATQEGAARWLGKYERGEDGRVLAAGAWSGPQLIGGAVLFHHDAGQRNIEVGCWVVSSGEGCGVAFSACRELLAIARSDLCVERVEWRTTTVNLRSRHLASRLGFRHEGTLRSNYLVRDTRYDTDVLALVGAEIDQAIATPPR